MLIVTPYQMVQLDSSLIGRRILCQKPLLKYFVLLHEDLIKVTHKIIVLLILFHVN
jgi:hypothetical protein